jgi:SWI/SNF-related matrix-associated actin-dependent regulator 1 of chromatin subfamily A
MDNSRVKLSKALDSRLSVPVPKGRSYLRYQVAGVEFCIYNPYINALVADEPGLGKTIQAIGVMNYMKSFPVLIICPASLLDNWKHEIEEWSTVKVDIQVIRSGKDKIRRADVYLVSFNLLTNLAVFKSLCRFTFALLIIDEIHFLKSPASKRTRAILGDIESPSMRGIYRKAKYTIGLSGTPLPNRPVEIYVIAKALCPESLLENGKYMTYDQFAIKYNGAFYQNGQLVLGTPSKKALRELGQRLRSTFMVRRKKKDVLHDLPDKTRQLVYLNKDSREICDLIDRMADFDISELEDVNFESSYVGLSEMRRELGELKVSHAVDYIKNQLESGHEKIIVFAHHKTVIEEIHQALKHYGISRIDGSTDKEKRQGEVTRFQTGKERIFLGSIMASGVGFTLTAASYVVFVEASWVPGERICVNKTISTQ